MELDFSKLITYKNKDKAVVGKKYYFIYSIELETIEDVSKYCNVKELEDISMVNHNCFYDGYSQTYPFIYPVEDE